MNKSEYVNVEFKFPTLKYKENKVYTIKRVIAEKYEKVRYLRYMIPTPDIDTK